MPSLCARPNAQPGSILADQRRTRLSATVHIAEFCQARRVAALIDMQREFLDAFEQMNREWLARAQSEASLASDFVSKLASANAAAAYQDWIKARNEMLAQDARRLIAGSERLAGACARFFANGSAASGS